MFKRDRRAPGIGLSLLIALLGLTTSVMRGATFLVRPQVAVTGTSHRDLLRVQAQVRAPRQLHVLAVRAHFQHDELATTTGDGSFDLRSTDGVSIDPPPHNRTYFDNQLRALSNYYTTVSNGKLTLSWELYPLSEEESYQLPHDMKYYSGAGDPVSKEVGWAHLLADAVQVADSMDHIDFAQFHCYIVFHAGVGADFELDLDPTPYDIQSAFLNLSTLRSALAGGDPSYPGIAVNNGQYFVQEGIILPETESQEGYEIGLLGPMAMLFGAQLGLPSLNDTQRNRPGVGRWSLMDQGSMNLQGLVPAQPCAWSKVFLGWEEPVVLRGFQENVRVASALAKSAPRIYKIPIDAKEYFLVENRQRDVNRDGRIVCTDALGRRVEILEDGRLLPVGWSGTIVRVDEYDFGLPGSGILIWHVDERVIEDGYADNRVNVDREHRGVDLVECDAAQDIGYYFGFPTYGYDAGDYWDPWWRDNESHKVANSAAEVVFGPSSMPSSQAYSGARTGITLTAFSSLDSVMSFDLRHEMFATGFPQFVGADRGYAGLAAAPLSASGDTTLLVAATNDGRIFAWLGDGSKAIGNQEKNWYRSLSGDTIWHQVALFAQWPQEIAHPPAVGDLNGDGRAEVVAVFVNGDIVAWQVADNDNEGRGDIAAVATIGCRPTCDLMLSSSVAPRLYIGTEKGEVHAFSWRDGGLSRDWSTTLFAEATTGLALAEQGVVATSSAADVALVSPCGETVWYYASPGDGLWSEPVLADINGDGALEAIVVQGGGAIFSLRLSDGSLLAGSGKAPDGIAPGVAAGDVDGDGSPEVVVRTATGLYAYEATGVVTNDVWAKFPPHPAEGHLPSPPVVSDVNGDGSADVVAYLPNRGVSALARHGQILPEWLFPVGDMVPVAPVVCDVEGDGTVELLVLSNDGFLYAWRTAGRCLASSLPWPQHRADASHQGVLRVFTVPQPQKGRLFVDRSVYCYPNPSEGQKVFVRYQLREAVDRVEVRVYDLLGELVAVLPASSYAVGDNEVEWRIEQVQAGVYLARVEAKKGAHRQVEFVRIAVVK